MTNTAFNKTQSLDHFTESQMADIAGSLNAIEPGAGGQGYVMPGPLEHVQISGGFEFFLLACLLCVGLALSTPHRRDQVRHIWRALRKIVPVKAIQKS